MDNELELRQKLSVKLLGLMADIGYVQKTGRNQQQNYSYVTEADLADKFREALLKNRLALVPSLQSRSDREITSKQGSVGTMTSVMMHYQIIDCDTGYAATYAMAGDGMDYGDKALYKAITGAKKYAMKELSVVSTGDDPENDSHEHMAHQDAPQAAPSSGPKPPNSVCTFPRGKMKGRTPSEVETGYLMWYGENVRDGDPTLYAAVQAELQKRDPSKQPSEAGGMTISEGLWLDWRGYMNDDPDRAAVVMQTMKKLGFPSITQLDEPTQRTFIAACQQAMDVANIQYERAL